MTDIKTLDDAIRKCELWSRKRKRNRIEFLDEYEDPKDPEYLPPGVQSRCQSDMENLYRVLPSLKKTPEGCWYGRCKEFYS